MTEQPAKLEPVLRTYDVDALDAERAIVGKSSGGYSYAMRADGESTPPADLLKSFEGWEATPAVDAPGLDDKSITGDLFLSYAMAVGPAATFRSFGGDYYGGMVTLNLAGRPTMSSPYAQHPMVYACVTKIADTIAARRIRLERQVIEDGQPKWVCVSQYGDAGTTRGGNGKRTGSATLRSTPKENALINLLNRPNPLQSGVAFRTKIVQSLLLDGECLVLFMNEHSKPMSQSTAMGSDIEVPKYLWPVRGEHMTPMCEAGAGALPKHYNINSGESWPAGAAAFLFKVSPDSSTRGMGPLSPVRRKLEQDYTVDRYMDALLKNGGQPGGFLHVKETIDRPKKMAIAQSWQEQHGGASNAGKVVVVDGGAEFKSTGLRPKDMEFGELIDRNSQWEMMVLGATKPVLGITDDVNRANAHEAMRVWYEVTIMPEAKKLCDMLNHSLVSIIKGLGTGAQPAAIGHRLAFDFSDVPFLKDDSNSAIDRAVKIAEAFGVTPRAAMELAGIEDTNRDIEGLDERWIATRVRPYDVAVDPAIYAPKGGGMAPEPAKAFEPITKAADGEPSADGIAEAAAKHERRAMEVWDKQDSFLAKREKPTAKATEAVLKSYVLAVRARVREIANGKRSAKTVAEQRVQDRQAKRGQAPETVLKYVASDAEIQRALALNIAEWKAAMTSGVLPELKKTIIDAAQALNLEVAGGETILALTDPAVVEFLAAKDLTLVEGATSTLAKDVQRKLVKILAGAEDATSLADAVREVLETLEADLKTMAGQMGARAEMIARTETASATSFGRTEQMGIDGVEQHEWISSRDGAVRDHHADLDQKVVKVGSVFAYGLAYPGDGSHGADPGDIVNCRCATMPVID